MRQYRQSLKAMNKVSRAIIVCGPASSGNHMITDMLRILGYKQIGQTQLTEDLPYEMPKDKCNIVIHRSYPNDDKWPDIYGIVNILRKYSYTVYWLMPIRDITTMLKAQLKMKYISSNKEGLIHLRNAFDDSISVANVLKIPWIPIIYEAQLPQLKRGYKVLKESLELLGITGLLETINYEIRDENAKYYS